MTSGTPPRDPPASESDTPRIEERYFAFSLVDAIEEKRKTFRIRYQVYCLERGLLPADAYPGKEESDAYDEDAVHVLASHVNGHEAGCARLVIGGPLGLPLVKFCALDTSTSSSQGHKITKHSVCKCPPLSTSLSPLRFWQSSRARAPLSARGGAEAYGQKLDGVWLTGALGTTVTMVARAALSSPPFYQEKAARAWPLTCNEWLGMLAANGFPIQTRVNVCGKVTGWRGRATRQATSPRHARQPNHFSDLPGPPCRRPIPPSPAACFGSAWLPRPDPVAIR